MKKDYEKIGDLIELIDERNKDLAVKTLAGLTIDKRFIPSVANTVGSNMKRYKIIRKNHFACSLMQVRRDGKMPIALLKEEEEAIISQAYPVFKVKDEQQILPEYLMMWFRRKEFDREATFHAVGGVRGSVEWEDFCNMELPVPSLEKQQKIIDEYQAVENKIKTNEAICEKLEASAQALYKHWFVDFEFPNEQGKAYKSDGGAMVWNDEQEKEIPEGWEVKKLKDVSEIVMGQSPKGTTYNKEGEGMIFYQGRTDFGFRIPEVRVFTTAPKRIAKKDDVLMSVRAPVGDLNVAVEECCIGRGLSAVRSNMSSFFFYYLRNLKSYFESDKGTGTIFSSINKGEMQSLKLIFNKKTALLFNDRIKNVEEQILNIQFQNQKLARFQEFLLGRMVKINKN